jgi:hypothetical protein
MSKLFGRKIETIINNREWSYPGLEISFNIKFDSDSIPDEADISIFNLSDDSIANINSGNNIIVNAGYGNDIGTILDGVIKTANLVRQGVDRELQIKALNVTNQYLNTSLSYTYGNGVTSEHLIRDLLGYIGIIPNIVNLASPQKYQLGFNANGKILDLIKRVADDADSRVIIRNSSISIVPDYSGDEDVAFILNANTGLLSIEPLDKTDTPAKYKVRMLLNHAVAPYTILQIDSLTFNGMALVVEGNHAGSGSNGDFITECEVMPL